MGNLKTILAASAAVIAIGAIAYVYSGGGGSAPEPVAVSAEVAAALESYGRPQLDRYRDADLKPGEVVSWAGIKPGMIVADILPENGYWTRILSGAVGNDGAVYMVVPAASGGGGRDGAAGAKFQDPNQNDPYNRTETARSISYQPEFKNLSFYQEPINEHLSVPKQLDALVLAGDYATLKGEEFSRIDTKKMNENFFRAIKKGGIYLVIGAAANKGAGFSAELGRSDPDEVKAEVLAAGFQLDGESTLLARPNDPRSAAADDTSDMFVLRFKKPVDAPDTDKRPPDAVAAISGHFGLTRRTNPGMIRYGGKGNRERRVMYQPDLTYQEYGQKGTGDNPWQSGTLFYGADGDGCMLHLFPLDQNGFTVCSAGRAAPGMKEGDIWFDGTMREFIGKGYILFPDKQATDGGTLGDTPQEIARNFGKYYGIAEKNGANQTYLSDYLGSFMRFRTAAGIPAAEVDKEFESTYGKAVPTMPAAPASGNPG